MKYLSALAVMALLLSPSISNSQQISPNPNPAGNTIKIDDQNAYNSLQFKNQGVVEIRYDGPSSAGGKLTNRSGGIFFNYHNLVVENQLVNASEGYLLNTPTGTIAKSKWLENHGVFDNHGQLGIVANGRMTNEYELTNSGTITNQKNGFLFNRAKGTFNTGGTVTNEGYFGNQGTVANLNGGALANHGEIANDAGATLTNGFGATMTNHGWIDNSGTVTNHKDAVVNFTHSGSIGNRGTVNNEGTWTNEGSVDNYKTFQNNWILNNEKRWNNTNGGTLTNDGTLVNKIGGSLYNSAGGTLVNNVVLRNHAELKSDGTLTNSTGAGIFNYKDAKLVIGEGGYDSPGKHLLTNSGTLDNDQGKITVYKYSTLNNGGTWNNNGEVYNGGTVDNTGTLTNSHVSMRNLGTLNNTGVLTNKTAGHLTNDGVLSNGAGGTLTNKGTVTNAWDGTLTNSGTLTIDLNAVLTNAVGGTLTNHGALNNNYTLNNDGTLHNESGGKLTNQYTLTNKGSLQNKGTLHNSGGADLVNESNATLANAAGGHLVNTSKMNNKGSLENHGTMLTGERDGQFTRGELTNSGMFNNYGSLVNESELKNYGNIRNTGTFTNNGELLNYGDGLIDTDHGSFINHGFVGGTGHIRGSFTDHGHTKPGHSAGVMTIEGDYFKVDGTKEIELGGLFDGGGDHSLTDHDWLNVTGDVRLAGTLDVKLLGGFELHRGNEFNFLRVGGTLTGQYEGLGEGDLVGNFGGQDLFITYGGGDGNDVVLFTNAVPEPTTVLIWSMLAGLGMTVRRRR